jgi:tetratricopeptide (TPR) repeat protein
MERYEYGDAAKAFRRAVELAPDSNPSKINLAIALLNDTGSRSEEEKKGSPTAGDSGANFKEALTLLDEVVAREPENLYAHYCRGVILQYNGQMAEANAEFKYVVDHDPADAHSWFRYGMTLTGPGLEQADQKVEIFTKAVECNPYLSSAWYALQQAHNMAAAKARGGDPDRAKALAARGQEILQLWRRLDPNQNPSVNAEASENFYGDMGPYAKVMDPFSGRRENRAGDARQPRFEVPKPLQVTLPTGHRWAQLADFAGPLAVLGRIRDRFGAAVAHFDADGDGRLDLFLAAAVKTPDAVRDTLLLNRGEGRFEDASAAFGLPEGRASTGVAAGDFDSDGRIDLFLTGVGENRLLRNREGKGFEDVTESLGAADPAPLSLSARWIDLDQDGDLDLYVINYGRAEDADAAFGDGPPPPGLPNAAHRNDGRPAPMPGPANTWAPAASDFYKKSQAGLSIAWGRFEGDHAAALQGGEAPHTGLAALDLDEDRDLDLVLAADGRAPSAVLNDRLGRFHAVELPDLDPKGLSNGLLVVDLDKDGRSDLVSIRPGDRLQPWRNVASAKGQPEGAAKTPGFAFEFWPTDAKAWRSAQAADLDLDGWVDLLGLPVPTVDDPPTPRWARNEGSRLALIPLALGPEASTPLLGVGLADLVGDPLPDILLVRDDGEAPRVAANLGNGNHWLGLAFAGRWKTGKGADGGPMRSNPQGIGTRVLLQGQDLNVPFTVTTPSSGPAQSAGPVILGLGQAGQAALIRLTWPDGVMQSELNADADQVLSLVEYNRKTGSCPVLFTFDGRRHVCIGDFLGGGGLGYLVAPGEYGQPDRDEAVAIGPDQLRPVDGVYRMSVTEPMDELAYLDQLVLEVVDRPPGVEATPDERFAPGGNRPTGELIAWKRTIEPERATDLEGRDVSAELLAFDRRTVDRFRLLSGWVGYAEEHGIVLDFGNRLSGFGPGDRLVLGLAGWVEYPYSQTNYAASTAGAPLKPPVLERLRDGGTWEVLEADPGYPAGMPRLTTLDLTGKLAGSRCVLRLRTNMECYYDRAFLALAEPDPGLRTTRLPVKSATLGYRGYTREISPDGRLPLIYDYHYIDPAPLARLHGRLTRYGDVTPLLNDDDDRLCLVGPGDEVKLEFDAASAPPLPEGWTRSYVLRSIGYCKDADPFTATSDTVGPLPWDGMPPYPFGPEGERPRDPAYEAYLREYQTREVRR